MTEDPDNMLDPPDDVSDDEAVREYGRQRAMDFLIRDAVGQVPSAADRGKIVPIRSGRWGRRKVALRACAAVVLVGLFGYSIWKYAGDEPESPMVALDGRWKIEAGAGAEYAIIKPNLVRLTRGELRFASVEQANLVVETPNAVATAQGTRFLIGHHPIADGVERETETKKTMNGRTMTRMLVLAGLVTLTNDVGSVEATANESVIAAEEEAPVKIAVEANSKFAFDLYAQLAKENEGDNLFFSPYSVSTALLMTAEGARGKTAEEMGSVLGFPESLRRVGEEVQEIPWEMGKLHVGLGALNHLFNQGRLTPEQVALAKKLEALENLLALAKKQTAEARRTGDSKGFNVAIGEEKKLVNEINAMRQEVDTIELETANALWGEQTYPFKKSYVETIGDAYDTNGIQHADFKADYERERVRINEWVEKKTKDRIKDLLPEESLDELTRLVLVNAIYFKGDWSVPFDVRRTREGGFSLSDGGSVNVPLMNKMRLEGARYAAFNGDGSVFETPVMINAGQTEGIYPGDDGFLMAELPYRGGDASMVVIAPNSADGLPEIESKLNGGGLSTWLSKLKSRDIHLTLPKFRSETTYLMNDTLAAMGMRTAFINPRDPDGADFGGMSNATDPNKKLYIGLVMHKAFVEVNEKGTEAAAATAVAAFGGGSKPDKVLFTPRFRADRPFVYLIKDNKTGTILFLGRMMNPGA